jgi:lipopolysaccharide biosynthesis glycosyltransferase
MTPSIVLACDARFAMPLATALRSIADSNQRAWPLQVYVLSNGLCEMSQEKILASLPKNSIKIKWIPIDVSRFSNFATAYHVSEMTYARILIPDLIPSNVTKVLYVDADVLVLTSLDRLWNIDLEGTVLGAVLDGLNENVKGKRPSVAGLPIVKRYFNAGVLLIDIAQWRKECVSERALNYLLRHPRSPFSDQDALNVVCDGRWKDLDPYWNFQGHLTQCLSKVEPGELPGIVHFITSLKPWDPSALSLNADFYDAFRSRTQFARRVSDRLCDISTASWSMLKIQVKRCVRPSIGK